MTKKRPRFGALPTLNMPQKSHQREKPPSRRPISIVKDQSLIDEKSKKALYNDFVEVCKRVRPLKILSEWTVQEKEDRLLLKKMRNTLLLPEIEIMIDDSLGYTISIFGWMLPENHVLYSGYFRSVRNITVSDLVKEVEHQFICPGVQRHEVSSVVVAHTIPKFVDPLFDDQDASDSFPNLQYWRTRGCCVLLEDEGQQCDSCYNSSHASELKDKAKQKKLAEPTHINTPVSKHS